MKKFLFLFLTIAIFTSCSSANTDNLYLETTTNSVETTTSYVEITTDNTETTTSNTVTASKVNNKITHAEFADLLKKKLESNETFKVFAPLINPVPQIDEENGVMYLMKLNDNIGVYTLSKGDKDIMEYAFVTEEATATDADRVLFLTMMRNVIEVLDPNISSDNMSDFMIDAPMDIAVSGTYEKTVNNIEYSLANMSGARLFTAKIN